MSRPTPETDACDLLSPNGEEAGNADYQRMLEHAKKLEGQRDELAEALQTVRKMFKKRVEVQYIESGTFQGGEEDTSTAGIDYDEDCVVISKAKWEVARKALATKEGGV